MPSRHRDRRQYHSRPRHGPADVYLKNAADKKYTAKFGLLVVMKDSAMTVHTQQPGVIEGGW
jgi:hypothetical protein